MGREIWDVVTRYANAQHASDDLEAESLSFLHAMPARDASRERLELARVRRRFLVPSALRFPVGAGDPGHGADVPRPGPRHHHGGHRDGRLQHHHRRFGELPTAVWLTWSAVGPS